MAKKLCVEAHAKINLCLNVASRREDGYHEMEMVMVPLDIHDELSVELAPEDTLICDEESLSLDETNTIIKAIHIMRNVYNLDAYFLIHLKKHIPMQAGLAGGSSDGAAVMRAINELLDLRIPLEELASLSKQIGADVPFCVMNTCAIVKGIGEKIEPIHMNCDFHILLVKPEEGVSTKKAFQTLDLQACEHPNCEEMKEACEHDDFEGLCQSLGNSLEYSAFQIVPKLRKIKQDLKDMGFDGVLMSGSGSTIFALTRNEKLISQACEQWKDKYSFVVATKVYQAQK